MSNSRHQQFTEEFRAFVEAENKQKTDAENRSAYERYLKTFHDAGCTAEGNDVPRLMFEQFVGLMPEDEPNAELRGAVAAHKALVTGWIHSGKEVIEGTAIDDADLRQLGFDISRRTRDDGDLSGAIIQTGFATFRKQTPAYDEALHFDGLISFLIRNRLQPTSQNIAQSFDLLMRMGLLQPKAEHPELNEHGVNLAVASDPEWEAQQAQQRAEAEAEQRRIDYRTKIVVTDPRDGTGWTQYQLDRCDSQTYRRLMFGDFGVPRITDVIQPTIARR